MVIPNDRAEGIGKRSPGRPTTLDATTFVNAAVEIIDAVGIDGLTMRALASKLNVSPMTLYRHVADKEELLCLIPDSLLAEVALDVQRRRRALPALRAVASGLSDVLSQHPKMAMLFFQPEPGLNMTAAGLHCAALLAAEGCPEREAFEILRAVIALVIGQHVTGHHEDTNLGVTIFLAGVLNQFGD